VVSFAAGALLAAVFLDILPEAIAALGPRAALWAGAGFALAGAFEGLVSRHEHEGAAPTRGMPSVLLASDALHNVGDGAAVAAAFLLSPRAGLVASVAVIAHEVPQEVGDFALLRHAGMRRGRALIALAATQLTAAVGALGVLLVQPLVTRLAGTILALAAGSFLYVGTIDLAPYLRVSARRGRRMRLAGFLAGVATVAAVGGLWP
jgi:zinc and cadmium transporter